MSFINFCSISNMDFLCLVSDVSGACSVTGYVTPAAGSVSGSGVV